MASWYPNLAIGLYAGASRSRLYQKGENVSIERETLKKMVADHEIRIMVATDAACEGLNLQTLGTLINIDLPWNTTRLEQRICRIKRFGQAREKVDMLNLVNERTVDEKVYDRLSERMRDRFNLFGSLPDTIKDPTEECLYGAYTKQAVALPESVRPDRRRVFCLAVTNEDRTGKRPTTWSAAIDQEAAGVTEVGERVPPRLFVVSAGNAPNPIAMERIADADMLEIEDPAQAWNAITVGGYTDLINIQEPEFKDYSPYARAGDISPYTRTSTQWLQGKAPFKPDIVMEAGNRVVSPARTDTYDADSLALLSTGPSTDRHPLVSFRATSAATAQAARLAARLTAEFPHYWPETIRALMIHGAQWTPFMKDALTAAGTKSAAYLLLRRYGHGVPTSERAAASARNHLAMISEAEIQPYSRSGKGMNECHFYSLPWPRAALESLGEQDVSLKITLSYFVEPNPGSSAAFDPYRYQSFGLRFDLKRRSETAVNFAKRLNKKAWEQPKDRPSTDSDGDRWLFGTQSMSAGSLHSDEWTGPAVNLLSRNIICIKPVGGWWKDRATADVRGRKALFAHSLPAISGQ